jgi:hypothetical protein
MSKIELNIEMLDAGLEEFNHVITQEEAEKLAKYFEEQDNIDYDAEELVNRTCDDAARYINDFEDAYYLETLQHVIGCLFEEKYNPVY